MKESLVAVLNLPVCNRTCLPVILKPIRRMLCIRPAGQQGRATDLIVFAVINQNAIRLHFTQNPGGKPYRF